MVEKANNFEVSNSTLPFFNEHIMVVNNSANLTLCLICKDSLANEDPDTVSTHVLSPRHEESLKNLFEICVFNDLCHKNNHNYMNMITSNLVFDISILLGNETSYIHRYENHIVCLICKDIISEVKGSDDDLKNDICTHLHGEQHLNNIKNNVCWVYRLKTVSGFLMFYKSAFFCSVCQQTYQNQVQNAAVHLRIDHPEEINKFTCNETKEIKQKQPKNCENNCPLKETSEESNNTTCVFGKTNDLNLEMTKTLDESTLIKSNENVREISSPKIEITKRNNVNPFIITVQCFKKLNFCAICKDIATDITSCLMYSDLKSHLLSSLHKKSLKSLLYQCTPDPFCEKNVEKYNKVASVLNNSSGCVLQSNNYLVCLICNNSISDITQSQTTIKYDLEYHFGSKKHLNIMRENVWWFYYLQFSEDFIAFDNHVNNCANCTSYIVTNPCHVVQCVKKDLQSANVMLKDETTPGLIQQNAIFSNNDQPKLDIYLSQSDSEEMSQSDSDSSDSENDDLEVLICPDCGEFIEIINENAEFSLQFHSQKHKDLKSINLDGELAFNPNRDYICPICQEIIPIFNRSLELSVSRHFEERKFDHEGVGFQNDPKEASRDLLANAFTKFPEALKKYESFIVFEEGTIFCKLCRCTIPVKVIDNDISDSVFQHVSSTYHEEQFTSFSQDLALVVVDYNKQYKVDQDVKAPDLFETIVRKQPMIQNNRGYIEKRAVNFFCNICQKHICYSPNEAMLTLNFVLHLKGPLHEKSLKQKKSQEFAVAGQSSIQNGMSVNTAKESNTKLRKFLKNKMFYLSRKYVEVNLNKNYIQIKKGKLLCIVCSQTLNFTEDGSHIKSHCNSTTHNEKLTNNAIYYKSQLYKEKYKINVNKKKVQLSTVLKELSTTEYLRPHVTYVVMEKQSFKCILCNTLIPPIEQSVKNHFFKAVHKKKSFATNQRVERLSKHAATPKKQAVQQAGAVGGVLQKTQLSVTPTKQAGTQAGVSQKTQTSSMCQETEVKSGNAPSESNKKAKKRLNILWAHSTVVRDNIWCIKVRNGKFFCDVCCETINSSGNGKHLLNHLKSNEHKNLL